MKHIKKTLAFFLLLAIGSLFASIDDNEPTLRTIAIIEVPGDAMPGWEKQIIELYYDEEGEAIPVVFRGAAKNWEAASWTPEYFAEHFGDEEITVLLQDLFKNAKEYFDEAEIISKNNLMDCAPERIVSSCNEDGLNCHEICLVCDETGENCWEDFPEGKNPLSANTTIKEHMTDILLNPKNAGYLLCPLEHNATKDKLESSSFGENSIFAYNLNLAAQTQFPQAEKSFNQDKLPREYAVFIGSGNSVTSLHNHGSTFLSQIYGKKIARLVHPKYSKECSCGGDDENVQFCAADIANPDFEKYPELKDIEVHQTILEPGDVLYIPDHWLHDIRGLSTSISISSGF